MSALAADARATIKNSGLTLGALIRFVGWVDGRWHGDTCGCTDDRCIGHHHDEDEDCGCLPVLLDDARKTLCQAPRPKSWDDQRCVHLAGHNTLHRSQDGGQYR